MQPLLIQCFTFLVDRFPLFHCLFFKPIIRWYVVIGSKGDVIHVKIVSEKNLINVMDTDFEQVHCQHIFCILSAVRKAIVVAKNQEISEGLVDSQIVPVGCDNSKQTVISDFFDIVSHKQLSVKLNAPVNQPMFMQLSIEKFFYKKNKVFCKNSWFDSLKKEFDELEEDLYLSSFLESYEQQECCSDPLDSKHDDWLYMTLDDV